MPEKAAEIAYLERQIEIQRKTLDIALRDLQVLMSLLAKVSAGDHRKMLRSLEPSVVRFLDPKSAGSPDDDTSL